MGDKPSGIMNGLKFEVFPISGIGPLLDNGHAAEEAGFDFISVQDHGLYTGLPRHLRAHRPDGPDPVPWTDVANPALRLLQTLANASTSLDLLVGGRSELGRDGRRDRGSDRRRRHPLRWPRRARRHSANRDH